MPYSPRVMLRSPVRVAAWTLLLLVASAAPGATPPANAEASNVQPTLHWGWRPNPRSDREAFLRPWNHASTVLLDDHRLHPICQPHNSGTLGFSGLASFDSRKREIAAHPTGMSQRGVVLVASGGITHRLTATRGGR